MGPILSFAQTSAYELTPPGTRLPPFLWSAFATVNKIHGIWRWYRRVEVYRNPNNFSQLLAGHLVNLVVGDRLLIRIAAQCLLICTRVLECAQEQVVLYQAGSQWMEAVKGRYPMPCKRSWKIRQSHALCSPSSAAWIQLKSQALWNRVKRITFCTAKVFLHLFQLSMRLMDAIDTFSLSPHTRNEGINEGFVNAMKWMDNLVENKEELLQGIRTNRILIERILRGSPFTYEQLNHCVSKTMEKTEAIYDKVKKISDYGNGIFIDLGKRMLRGGMLMIGVSPRQLPLKAL